MHPPVTAHFRVVLILLPAVEDRVTLVYIFAVIRGVGRRLAIMPGRAGKTHLNVSSCYFKRRPANAPVVFPISKALPAGGSTVGPGTGGFSVASAAKSA